MRSTASRSHRRSRPRAASSGEHHQGFRYAASGELLNQRSGGATVEVAEERCAAPRLEATDACNPGTPSSGEHHQGFRYAASGELLNQRSGPPPASYSTSGVARLRRASPPAEWGGARSCRAKRGCGFGSAALASGLAGAHRRQAIRGGMRRGTESAPPRSDARDAGPRPAGSINTGFDTPPPASYSTSGVAHLRRATQPAEWRGARSCRAKRGCGFGSAALASGLAGAHRRQAIRGGMRRGTESAPPRSVARRRPRAAGTRTRGCGRRRPGRCGARAASTCRRARGSARGRRPARASTDAPTRSR